MPDAATITAVKTSLACGTRTRDVAKAFNLPERYVRTLGWTLHRMGRDFDPGGPDAPHGDLTSATAHVEHWDQRPAQRTRQAELARAREAHEDFLLSLGLKPYVAPIIIPAEPKRAKPGPLRGALRVKRKRAPVSRGIEDARHRLPNDLQQSSPFYAKGRRS